MTLKNANHRLAYLGFEVRKEGKEYQAKRLEWSWRNLKCFHHASLDTVMIWAGYDVMKSG